ncbi:MAG: LysM peptidoglycan-binding domain-containing protein, partial [Acidimicrobiales bacterium]
MRQIRVTSFFLVVALTLSSCGILGGSDSTDVAVAEDVAAQPTVNNVQSVPAQTPGSTTDGGAAALPTAVTLPTAAPMPEPTVDRSQPTTYIVQSGDVLGLIAERFDADIAELRLINNLDGNLIRVGQALTIPALDGLAAASDDEGSTETAGASSGPVSCNSTASGHCVQPGESLLGIALEYDVTVESLRAANPGVSGDLIKSGEVLNLPGEASNPAP